MTRLHFQPIRGNAIDIIETILQCGELSSLGDAQRAIRLVVEELVVNIADYAYPEGDEGARGDYLDVEITCDAESITLRFHDGGMPFNPLAKEPPDISLSMKDRPIGGLGIFMVMNTIDALTYEYTAGENILTVTKKIKK